MKCTLGDNIPNTYDGRPGTIIHCGADVDGTETTGMVICTDATIVSDVNSCNDPTSQTNKEIFQLTLGA